MDKLPKITVVTPSYNQGRYVERAILSILNQNYPMLEYMVLDGGSSDDSRKIIEKYSSRLSWWRSAPDKGQASAIAEGFERSTGQILCWINSDDMLLPGALHFVGNFFARHSQAQWLLGSTIEVDENDCVIRYRKAFPVFFNAMASVSMGFCQQSSFWQRELYKQAGPINAARRFCMDYDLFIRFARLTRPAWVNRYLGVFRKHGETKTSLLDADKQKEDAEIMRQWGGHIPGYKAKLYWFVMTAWGKLTTRVVKNKIPLSRAISKLP